MNILDGEKRLLKPRIRREEKTIEAMLKLFCKSHHQPSGGQLCSSCEELKRYALKRLHACPFAEKKPTCGNCLIHCYNKVMRERIREVMRFSGPRLGLRHPILALCHLADGRIKPQQLPKKKNV